MAFDSSSQTGSRYLGEGFRQEPDFREAGSATTTFPAAQSGDTGDDTTVGVTRRVPNLDYVFDDPAEGEPGRDRMLVHGVWELLLAVALASVGYLVYQEQSSAFGGDGLRVLLLDATILGLLAAGSAFALRAAVPNLAVGGVAVAAALYFGADSGGGLLAPMLTVLGVCAAIGAVQGLVVVGLHVPSWAASLGVGLALLAWWAGRAPVALTAGYNPAAHAYWWFGGFCALSLGAAVVGLVPYVRRSFGRFRPVADPARRRGFVAALIALVATVVSTMLAGLAGVLAVSVDRSAAPSDGLALTALALGTALLGGTSAFGRRGGIFGTIFAVGLVTVAIRYAEATERTWPLAAVAAGAIGVGLAATRLVERFGRPSFGDDEDDDDWVPKSSTSWSAKPAPSTSGIGGLWASDEAWGTTDAR